MEASSQILTAYTYEPETQISPPVNVYGTKDNNVGGWIILSFILAMFIIILLILWIVGIWNNNNIPICNCYGPYGIQLSVDGNAIMQCGTGNNQTCTFIKSSISDCVAQCEDLSNICQSFTYNSLTSTMKIVQQNGLFSSPQTNLYIKQAGAVY